jgi:hypothetical protein
MTGAQAGRQEFGFRRTECGCELCRAPCRHIPGGLAPPDLTALCPPGQDVFRWAEEHLRALTGPVPTLVPARRGDGACHWHFDGKCAVHQHAPFGCAFFDSHMSADEERRRSAAGVRARREDAAAGGLCHRVWLHLCRLGLKEGPADRSALAEEARRMVRHRERRRGQLRASDAGSG